LTRGRLAPDAEGAELAALFTGSLLRFVCGIGGAVLVGAIVFRGAVLQPGEPAFECLTVGSLAAGLFTLVRTSMPVQAWLLALVFAALRLVFAPAPWNEAIVGLVLGCGLLLVAVIFDLLAQSGWRLGKFLLVGPLVGGLYLALAPLTEFAAMNLSNAGRLLLFRPALGLLIGEGVALGVELAELVPLKGAVAAAGARDALEPVPRPRSTEPDGPY